MSRQFRPRRLVKAVVKPERLDFAEPRDRDDVDFVVVVRGERGDVLAAVKFFDERCEHVAEGDHEDDLTLVLPENLRHERYDLVGIPDRNVEVETFGHSGGGLLGSAVIAGVDRIDPRNDVEVLDDIGKQFGSLAAKAVQRRVDFDTGIRIGMPDENQRGGGLLLGEPCQREYDEDENGNRYQSRPAPLLIPRFRSAYSSAPKHIPLVAILPFDRALFHYRVFDLDDLAGRR